MSLDLNSTLRKLETYYNSPAPILSVYLEIPTQGKRNENLVTLFHDVVSLSLTQDEQKTFEQAIGSIEGYLQKYAYDSDEKGLAFFVGGDNLWEVIHTKGPAATSLVIKHSPNLIPLYEEEKNNYKYLIVLVDREKAKFIILSQGEIEEQDEVKDHIVPQKIHTGDAGSRQNKVDRHFDKLLSNHLHLIQEKLEQFTKDKPIAGVIIGGHKITMNKYTVYLPKHLQDKVIGEFVSELNISTNDILNHAKKLLEKLNIESPARPHAQLTNP